MPHIHLTILISARWSATSFSFLPDKVSLPCNILLRTQLLYNLPVTTHTHTHPFMALLDFVWSICKSASWPRHITTPASHYSVFYRLDALPDAQPTASKHWSTNSDYKQKIWDSRLTWFQLESGHWNDECDGLCWHMMLIVGTLEAVIYLMYVLVMCGESFWRRVHLGLGSI